MPLTAFSFYGIATVSLCFFVGLNIVHQSWGALPSMAVLSNMTPIFIFTGIVYFIASRIRSRYLAGQQALLEVIKSRDQVIDMQSKRLAEAETKAALGRMSAQVAHDLCSPISALGVLIDECKELSREKSQVLYSIYERIQGITDSLMANYRKGHAGQGGPPVGTSEVLLLNVLDSIVAEKRIEYRHKPQLQIVLDLNASAFAVFVDVQALELKRILSNVVNNAVQALSEGESSIRIGLSATRLKTQISVLDAGRGISPKVLAQLNDPKNVVPVTSGKAGGCGLGLSHAKSCLAQWGGTLKFDSVLEVGTKVTIELPRKKAPSWFTERLKFYGIDTVVVVDSDDTVHHSWDQRLRGLPHLSVLHFYSPHEFKNYGQGPKSPSALYLVDQEFRNSEITGADLIEDAKLGAKAVLVTTRYQDKSVRQRALKSGFRILPKSLAQRAPLSLKAPDEMVVLVDDEPLARQFWKMSAEDYGVPFLAFENVGEFLKAWRDIPTQAAIYLDSDLGEAQRGEILAKRLSKLGFKNLVLSTGYDPSSIDLAMMPWIKKVVGKDPPWKNEFYGTEVSNFSKKKPFPPGFQGPAEPNGQEPRVPGNRD